MKWKYRLERCPEKRHSSCSSRFSPFHCKVCVKSLKELGVSGWTTLSLAYTSRWMETSTSAWTAFPTRPLCLVYSFGIKDDWTFEDEMDSIGCTVHAYDHTIDAPSSRGHRITFHKLGLGTETNMDTLDNIIRVNGHTETSIHLLKVWLYFKL